MRKTVTVFLLFLLGGGAVVRNLLDDDYGKWTLADWMFPILFIFIGIALLFKKGEA